MDESLFGSAYEALDEGLEDEQDLETGSVSWGASSWLSCEHFLDGECAQLGAPCPSGGNAASYSCLLEEEGTLDWSALEAS